MSGGFFKLAHVEIGVEAALCYQLVVRALLYYVAVLEHEDEVGIVMCFSPLFSVLTLAYMVGFHLILLGIDGIVMAVSNFTRR